MFTEKELRYIHDTDFLLTKGTVTEKVGGLLNQTHDLLKQYIASENFAFPAQTQARAGKISRGENYQQLPYLLLDYPRKFTRQDVFALRTMFWWGQFFSVTFQLGGESWQRFRPTVQYNAGELLTLPVSLCISDDPWQHHREPTYYQPVSEMSLEGMQRKLEQQPFLKLVTFLPLRDWKSLPDRALTFFRQMAHLIEL